MSPPDHYSAHFLLNPWMDWREEVSVPRAEKEWDDLRETVCRAGATVEVMPSSPAANALTFIRDDVLVYGDRRALALRVGGYRAAAETSRVARWLGGRGYQVQRFPPRGRIDGGNILRLGGSWVVGMTPTTDGTVERRFARFIHGATGERTFGLRLPLRPFNHIDMVLADLGGRGWLLYRRALGDPDLRAPLWRSLLGGRPVIEVTDEEAERLACNVLVVGGTAVAGWLSPRLERRIGGLGFSVAVCPLEEFAKAGAGPHCLVAEL
jgi:N-dimethylarginine dimethylaminohydrolase